MSQQQVSAKHLVIAFALVGAASFAAPGRAQMDAPAVPPVSTAVSVNAALVEDITRLWKASLSEDFIRKYVAHADLARDLTAEDIVRLRNAGVPETLIASITRRHTETVATASPVAAAALAAGPQDSRRWDGLTRRNSGVVMLKSRWDSGVLEFKDGSLRWVDSRDSGKNVLVPAAQVTEQQLTCLKKSGGNECFEWVLKTRGEEYRFRDVAWQQNENAKVEDLFAFFSGAYPNMISSRRPVDEK